MHDRTEPGTDEIVYLLAELRSEGRGTRGTSCGGTVHEIGSRARVLGVEGDELRLALAGCNGETIISCPQRLVAYRRRSLAASPRPPRVYVRVATA